MEVRRELTRRLTVFVFWLLGFAIGFVAYLLLPNIALWFTTTMPNFLNQALIGALITGIVGSIISTFAIMSWANKTT